MEGNETDIIMEEYGLEAARAAGNSTGDGGFWGGIHQTEEINQRREECNAFHSSLPTPDPSSGVYCPRTFDGWSCWNDTPAGTRAYVSCPEFITGFDPNLFAHKDCEKNGVWFVDPRTNQTWSNYTTCVNIDNLHLHQGVNKIYIAGYSLSLIALCISLFIFCFFKSLKCTRVTIHKNLFVSFIINNALWLLWYECVLNYPDVLTENGAGCQVLHVFLHYFLVSNYFWMFCEGLYLHTLLVVAFVAEDRIMKWFYILGWGVPAVWTVIYASCRANDKDENKYCWMEDGVYNYILNIPVVVSMFVNLFFLINIVRVLVTKLRSAHTTPDTHSTRKAVRATLILIPLLGLHYILIPFRPSDESPAAGVYLIISALAASFQGLGVSLLFCFFNGEVLGIFKKKWSQHKMMHGPQSIGATTFSYMKSSMADGNTTVTNYGTTIEGDDV